jgi:hypothetical protein
MNAVPVARAGSTCYFAPVMAGPADNTENIGRCRCRATSKLVSPHLRNHIAPKILASIHDRWDQVGLTETAGAD